MPIKMIYICSCGEPWPTNSWEQVITHIEANPTHTVTEAYAETAQVGIPRQIPVLSQDGGAIYRVSTTSSGGIVSESDQGVATSMPKSTLDASTDPGVDDDESEGYASGSRWLNTSTGEEFVCFDATNGAAVWGSTTESGGGSGVWGTDAATSKSLSMSTTTNTGWVTKLVLEAEASEAGTYRIGWSYHWRAGSTSHDFRARLLHEASELWDHRQESKDRGKHQSQPASGFMYVNLSAGTHTFTLQWAATHHRKEVSIEYASLEFWRHS